MTLPLRIKRRVQAARRLAEHHLKQGDKLPEDVDESLKHAEHNAEPAESERIVQQIIERVLAAV